MSVRNALLAGTFVAALAVPTTAFAAAAFTTGAVNMRTGPSTRYHRILTIPAGARIHVRDCGGWCSVRYHGRNGYVSARYVTYGGVRGPRRHFRRPPPPTRGWYRRPWWDERHGAWYDGRRWYFRGRWHDRPSGLTFGFGFGG